MTYEVAKAIKYLKQYKHRLTPQQFRTIRGQILSGDTAGARKGLWKIIR